MPLQLPCAPLRWLTAALVAATLTACGGGGSTAEPEPNPNPPTQPGGPTTPEPSNPDPTPTTPVPDPSTPNPTPTVPTTPDPSSPTPTPTVPNPTPTTPPPGPPPPPPQQLPPLAVNLNFVFEQGTGQVSTVTANFSRLLNSATVNTASFAVFEDATNERLPAALSRPNASQAVLTRQARLRPLTRYRVELANSIAGAAGERFAGTTTFFTSADYVWATPTLAIGSVVNSESPSLAMAPSGNAVVAFQANAGTGIKDVRAITYDAATGAWSGSSEFLSNRTHDVAGPVKVVMDNQGSAIAVWSQLNGTASNGSGTRTDIFSSRKRFDGVWTVANLLEADDRGNTSVPDVGVDGAGNAIAVWQQFDSVAPVTGTVFFSRYDVATGIWSAAAPLEIATDPEVAPKIAMNSAGNALVVYRKGRDLFAMRYRPANNAWDARQPVHVTANASITKPQIRMNATGHAVVVYEISDTPASRTDISSNQFNAVTNSWGAPRPIENETLPATIPQVSMDAGGNATAVWRQSLGGGFYQTYANHMPWSTKVWGTASSVLQAQSLQDNPQIADDAGGPIAVFEYVNGSGVRRIASARLQQGLASLGAADVERDGGDTSQPQIAIDAQGRAITAYRLLLNGNQRTRASHLR